MSGDENSGDEIFRDKIFWGLKFRGENNRGQKFGHKMSCHRIKRCDAVSRSERRGFKFAR